MSRVTTEAVCPICEERRLFTAPDDFWSCRGELQASDCKWNGCIPRQRALADVLFSLYPRDSVPELDIHESSPAPNGISLWLRRVCPKYVMSGYFPEHPFGRIVKGFRNEDLERQTFPDASFDLVLHLDVLEHLFDPFQALREIRRTLRPDGTCLFTAPTYPDRAKTEQVAFQEPSGIRVVGAPEYHGNPQDPKGSLVTWRYGYDLPYRISKETGFDVEVRRWYSPSRAIMGTMTEVYILRNWNPTRA
jgi:SAM-dependent methyltransferase